MRLPVANIVRRQCAGVVAIVAMLGMAFSIATAAADQNDTRLWELLSAQDQASGRFLQEIYAEDGELLERSSGRYAVLRPDFFRWEIDYPDRQQIVVAGDVLWHYDIDLAAASRRDTRENSEFNALELLAGDSDELRERFAVEVLGDDRYRLVPRFVQAGFTAVDLSWRDGAIIGMEISDRSGQRIRLALTPAADASTLTPADFEFDLPEGVDVYDPTAS
jgi:outer membrane lipoprotein carrier protein